MARNIFEKKKRVTHVKGLRNSIDYGDMLPGEIDYVSSIINDMDEHMKSNNFKINHSETRVSSKTQQNKDEKDKAIPPTTKNSTQLFKKLSQNRKYPLMEKSQKVLRQLKHNQSIPKQRAHLSSVPSSLAKNNHFGNTLPIKGKDMHSMENIKRNSSLKKNIHNESCENSTFKKGKSFLKGTEKSNLKKIEGFQNTTLKSHVNSKNSVPSSTKRPKASENLNKASNTSSVRTENSVSSAKRSKLLLEDDFHSYYERSYFRSNVNTKNITDDQSDSNSGNSTIHNRSNSSASSRSNSSISSRSNSIINKESSSILNEKNKGSIDDADTDDGDSEFEKFLERSKKGIRKKSKISQKKAKTVKRSSRKTIRKLSYSESSDDEVSPLKHKKNKKMKVTHEKLKSKSKVVTADESEADLIGDTYTRDSSSENDNSFVNTACSSLSAQSKENESYVSLVVSPLKHKKNKKMKVTREKLKSKSKVVTAYESEADLIGDTYTRDSSSENDESSVNTTCTSLSAQSKENESYVSLPEPKDEVKSKTLMTDESEVGLMNGEMYKKHLPSERDTAHVNTNCSSLYVQSKDKDCYLSLPEPNAITDEENIMDSLHNNQTLSSKYEKGSLKQMPSADISLDSDDYAEKASLISPKSSVFINEGSNVEKLENDIPECIELSSSEEDECPNLVIDESDKSVINISVFSEAATLNSTVTDPKKYDLKTVGTIFNAPTKDSEESDIEIIDVVVTESKKPECSIEMDNNFSAIYSKENSVTHNVQRIKCEPQTRQVLGIQIKKEKEHSKNMVTDSNHGAVFATDICKGIDSNDSLKFLQLDSNVTMADKTKYTSFEGSSYDQFASSRIKKEEGDIVIDSAKTLGNEKLSSKGTNVSSKQDGIAIKRELPEILVDYISEHKKCQGLPEVKTMSPIVQKINCQPYLADKQKCENDDLNKESIKLGEVSSSNILSTKSLRSAALEDLIPSLQINKFNIPEKTVTLSHLFKLFKQEFQTYQELIEVETSLETRLKQIETNQAEKLMWIKSLIQHVVGTSQSEMVDDSLKIVEAINKIYNSEDLKKLNTKECINNLVSSCSSKLNSEKKNEILSRKEQNISGKLSIESSPLTLADKNTDEKNFSSFNSSQLKKLKLEPVSVEDSTDKSDIAMKLLGEKCVICCKNAVAACQKCAKVFFCSNECGIKSWNDGHKDVCGKL